MAVHVEIHHHEVIASCIRGAPVSFSMSSQHAARSIWMHRRYLKIISFTAATLPDRRCEVPGMSSKRSCSMRQLIFALSSSENRYNLLQVALVPNNKHGPVVSGNTERCLSEQAQLLRLHKIGWKCYQPRTARCALFVRTIQLCLYNKSAYYVHVTVVSSIKHEDTAPSKYHRGFSCLPPLPSPNCLQ